MQQPIETIAHKIAKRLEAEIGKEIVPYVEAKLNDPNDSERSLRFFETATAIALASLVISAAGVVWTIARDLLGSGQKPDSEYIARKALLELEIPQGVSRDQAETIVRISVEETISNSKKHG